MRGSPVLRAVLCGLVLVGLWPGVVKVTAGGSGDGDSRVVAAPSKESSASEVAATLVCTLEFLVTAPCRSLVVEHLGTELFAVDKVDGRLEREVKLEFPPQGVDLVVRWNWEPTAVAGQESTPVGGDSAAAKDRRGGAEHAARIRLRMPDGSMEERTVWGRGQVEEVLSFGGKAA